MNKPVAVVAVGGNATKLLRHAQQKCGVRFTLAPSGRCFYWPKEHKPRMRTGAACSSVALSRPDHEGVCAFGRGLSECLVRPRA